MSNKAKLIAEIQAIGQSKTNLRARERSIQKVEGSGNPLLFSQPAVKKNALKETLQGLLPPELIPSNVGSLSEVTWGFSYQVDFELGENLTFDHNFRASKNFKVNNEAAFLVTRIYRKTMDADQAGNAAPLCINFRDLQSSRQLNDNPIPLQAIPSKGYYLELPVPFLIYPSASLELELTSWLPSGVSLPTEGNNYQGFTLYGARVRIKDQNQVIKTSLMR